jgi:hypothetical protein
VAFLAQEAQSYVKSKSRSEFSTTDVVNDVYERAKIINPQVKRPNMYNAVYEALRRMQDENAQLAWIKQEPPGSI